jgi:hypothetical protein
MSRFEKVVGVPTLSNGKVESPTFINKVQVLQSLPSILYFHIDNCSEVQARMLHAPLCAADLFSLENHARYATLRFCREQHSTSLPLGCRWPM